MVVILVHWLIRRGAERQFEAHWRRMGIDKQSGLYREILTTLDEAPPDDKFHTFSIGDPFYTTYINIALWESVEKFEAAVRKYMPKTDTLESGGELKRRVELDTFEFKLRERAVLRVITDRGGSLPDAELAE